MKNSVDREICPREWRNLPVRVEGFARGGGEIGPRAKEKEQTGESGKRYGGKE